MEVDELREQIARFPVWQYEFEFDGGVRTPVGDPKRSTATESGAVTSSTR